MVRIVDAGFRLAKRLKGRLDPQTQKYAQTLIDVTEREIAVQAAIFFLALLLCAYSFRVIVRRVIRPINAMVDALLKATRGESVDFVLRANGDDEIGKLAQVLRAFQENLEQVRRTADELDRSENHSRAVVDHTLDGLITIDATGTIKSFNHACERIFGYSASDVVGQNVKILMPEPYHGEHDGYLSRYLSTGDAHIIGTPGREVSAKRKEGSIFPIDLSISAFTSGDGRHFSGIIRDITLRKQAEEALARHTQALERSNKELDDFAYIASHDLKEPCAESTTIPASCWKTTPRSSIRKARTTEPAGISSASAWSGWSTICSISRGWGGRNWQSSPPTSDAVIADIEITLEHFLEERAARIIVPRDASSRHLRQAARHRTVPQPHHQCGQNTTTKPKE